MDADTRSRGAAGLGKLLSRYDFSWGDLLFCWRALFSYRILSLCPSSYFSSVLLKTKSHCPGTNFILV